ncbi:unnamed protein product [Protopolystoma xenopodis]|uniref:BEACH domain-containing protein n=1 Tax=Protopolystoma xenopodis TaxID=117903 RepID=A0A3S5AGH8_9PLAT|nr:unnamed protein product [Protopolystoma xenopodis]
MKSFDVLLFFDCANAFGWYLSLIVPSFCFLPVFRSTHPGRILQVIFGHHNVVTCLARSECNLSQRYYLASGGADAIVMLWIYSDQHMLVLNDSGGNFGVLLCCLQA